MTGPETPIPDVVPFPLLAAATAAASAAGQLVLGQATGLLSLDGEFTAGAERVRGVTVTLLIWLCALTAPAAVSVARRASLRVRFISAAGAVAGAAVAWPVAALFASGADLGGAVGPAVLGGIALGAVAAAITAALPELGAGIAAHAGLLWMISLAASVPAIWAEPGPTMYAGFTEDRLLARLGVHGLGPLPDDGFVTLLVLAAFAVVVQGVVLRRSGRWATALRVVVAGPVLAAVAYRVDPDQLTLWNIGGHEGALTSLVMMAALAPAGLGVAALRRRRGLPRRREVERPWRPPSWR